MVDMRQIGEALRAYAGKNSAIAVDSGVARVGKTDGGCEITGAPGSVYGMGQCTCLWAKDKVTKVHRVVAFSPKCRLHGGFEAV